MIELQPAYILHARPYRDTSMLVDFFTPEFGRMTAVVRGVRSRKTPKRNLLNPFTQLLISFQGKTDLKLLTHFEPVGTSWTLLGKHLYSGFYLNEILLRLLAEWDAHEDIYRLYECSLQALHTQVDIEPLLRDFELQLLDALGYGIHWEVDAKSGEPIRAEQDYCVDPQHGFYWAEEDVPFNFRFKGAHLLAIGQRDFSTADIKQTAKRITRILLKPLLGSKPLMSRELFQ